jgi:hypothetical protein
VVGEVGAGYLKSKSVISYSSLIGTDLSKIAEVPKFEEGERTSSRIAEPSGIFSQSDGFPQSISADEITKHWPDFVNCVSKTHIAVGTSLTETYILDIQNGMVRISCPDDYHFSTLKRHKDLLASTLCQVIGKRFAIEPVLRSNPNLPVKEIYTTISRSSVSEKYPEKKSDQDISIIKEHPILTLFKRELGAERIE